MTIFVMSKGKLPVTPGFHTITINECIIGRHELIDALEGSTIACR